MYQHAKSQVSSSKNELSRSKKPGKTTEDDIQVLPAVVYSIYSWKSFLVSFSIHIRGRLSWLIVKHGM